MNEERIKEALDSIARRNVPDDIDTWPLIASRFERRSLAQALRARPVLLIVVLLLSLALLSGAVYAIGRLAGFVPGFGFATGEVYVLDEPVELVQNGITLRLEGAVYDGSKLWVELSTKNLPVIDDLSKVYLLLPDKEHILVQRGGAIMPDANTVRLTYLFSEIGELSQPFTLVMENLGGETFEIKFSLRPARADEVLPALPEADLPVQSEMRDGIALVLENVAMSSDRTVLQVSLRFEKPGMFLAGPWSVRMMDSEGRVYPLKNITPETLDLGTTQLYQTVALQENERITLSLVGFPHEGDIPATMDFSSNPTIFAFDPGQNPQVGQTWPLDETMQAGDFSLHLVGARMTKPGELLFEFEPEGNVTGVMLWSAFASSAAGGVPVDGNFTAGITFTNMPDGPLEIQVNSVYYSVHGPWEVEWQTPAAVAANFPTVTPAPSPTPLVIPTLSSQDPLLLEVQALAEKFDAAIVQGPAWVHVVSENFADNLQPGQTYPPPYYQEEQWYEIDTKGWVARDLMTHRNENGNILQQGGSIGTKTFNLTTGESFEISPYRLSFDFFVQDLDFALSHGEQVTSKETTCEDGSPCLLVSISNPIGGRKVWVNLQTGQQIEFQSFQRLADGTEQLQFTQRFILVERVPAPPQEVLDVLGKVAASTP